LGVVALGGWSIGRGSIGGWEHWKGGSIGRGGSIWRVEHREGENWEGVGALGVVHVALGGGALGGWEHWEGGRIGGDTCRKEHWEGEHWEGW